MTRVMFVGNLGTGELVILILVVLILLLVLLVPIVLLSRNKRTTQYQYGMQGSLPPPQPESYLGFAIFATLCCCVPLGIVAILKSNKVGAYYKMKQYDAAVLASDEARKWCLCAYILGGILQFINIVYIIDNYIGNI